MLIPLLVLAVLSVVGGLVGVQYFMVDTFTGSHLAPGSPFETFLMPALGEAAIASSEEAHHLDLFTEWVLTGASVGMAVLGRAHRGGDVPGAHPGPGGAEPGPSAPSTPCCSTSGTWTSSTRP